MANFKKFLEKNKKEYPVRLKFIENISEKQYLQLQNTCRKYDLIYMSPIKKTLPQQHPLDFYDVEHAEVYIIDIILGYPVVAHILTQDIKLALALPEKFIAVRTKYREQEQHTLTVNTKNEIYQSAIKKGLEQACKLSTDSEYNKSEESLPQEVLAGDKYTDTFKKHLSQLRKNAENKEIVPHQTKNGLFKWLDDREPYKSSEDFNKDIPGAPKIYNLDNLDDKPPIDLYYQVVSKHGQVEFVKIIGDTFIDPKTGLKVDIIKNKYGEDF